MHRAAEPTLRQLHDRHMDSWDGCPDGPDCPFCIADRQAEERELGLRNTPVNWGAIPEVIQPSELSPPDQARWDNEGNHTND